MSRGRITLDTAATMMTFLAIASSATAAEILTQRQCTLEGLPCVIELQPGMTKIVPVPPNRRVQAIIIGNPNIADASPVNVNAIAITGKGTGLTNVILFDGEGEEIFNEKIQVVGADAYKAGNVRERHEVRVVSIWGGASSRRKEEPNLRRYLCAQNCSTIELDKPVELNPPGNTSAAVGGPASAAIAAPPGPEGPPPQGSSAQAPPSGAYEGNGGPQ